MREVLKVVDSERETWGLRKDKILSVICSFPVVYIFDYVHLLL